MQHSPARTAVTSALIAVVIFAVGWIILRAFLDTTLSGYMPYFVAALGAIVWGGWAGYRAAKKRTGVSR